MRRILLARPFVPVPGQEKLVEALQPHAREIFGEEIPTNGVPIYTDARLYTERGIPTVLYGAGPHSLLEGPTAIAPMRSWCWRIFARRPKS